MIRKKDQSSLPGGHLSSQINTFWQSNFTRLVLIIFFLGIFGTAEHFSGIPKKLCLELTLEIYITDLHTTSKKMQVDVTV